MSYGVKYSGVLRTKEMKTDGSFQRNFHLSITFLYFFFFFKGNGRIPNMLHTGRRVKPAETTTLGLITSVPSTCLVLY